MTRRALVTGSSRGIGRAVAEGFLAEGWHVSGIDINPPSPDLGERLHHVECDLQDALMIPAAVTKALDGLPLDALVNKAALQLSSSLRTTSDAEWDAGRNTNVKAAFVCIRESADALIAAKGSIINVSSVHAVATSTNIGAYATSKGALTALTRAAAIEFGDAGVRCNAILPGAIDTEMLREGLGRRPHPDGPEGNLRALVDRTPLGEVGEVGDVAQAVLFLASGDGARFMTGQSLVVDGGVTIALRTE